MDEKLRTIKKTYTKAQLESMTLEELVALVGKAGPNATFTGTGVVRKKDGTIRYDKDAVPGEYFESPEDLKNNDEASKEES